MNSIMANQPLAIILLIAAAFMVTLLAWAPGHVARTRNHRSAEAIGFFGQLSLFLPPLWFIVMIWAYTGKHTPPTNKHQQPQPVAWTV